MWVHIYREKIMLLILKENSILISGLSCPGGYQNWSENRDHFMVRTKTQNLVLLLVVCINYPKINI